MKTVQTFDSSEKWQEFKELIPNFDETTFRESKLLEQTNITKDSSDYFWYTMRYITSGNYAIDNQTIVEHNFLWKTLAHFINTNLIERRIQDTL